MDSDPLALALGGGGSKRASPGKAVQTTKKPLIDRERTFLTTSSGISAEAAQPLQPMQPLQEMAARPIPKKKKWAPTGGGLGLMGGSERHRKAMEEKRRREEEEARREKELESERMQKKMKREAERMTAMRQRRETEDIKRRSAEAGIRGLEKALSEAMSAKGDTAKRLKDCKQVSVSVKRELAKVQKQAERKEAAIVVYRDEMVEAHAIGYDSSPTLGRMPIAECGVFSSVLASWGITQAFAKILGLAKFSIDAWCAALSAPTESVLLIETARRLLEHATFDLEPAPTRIGPENWEDVLRASWPCLRAKLGGVIEPEELPDGSFAAFELDTKARVLRCVATCAVRSPTFRAEVEARREAQARAVVARKDELKDARQRQKDETAKFREDALRAIKRDREKAKLAKSWDDEDEDGDDDIRQETPDEPTAAEVARKAEQLRDAQICENRAVLDDAPSIDDVSSDEETGDEAEENSRSQTIERRRELASKRSRNLLRKARRVRKAQLEEARQECEAWFRRHRTTATAAQLRAWLREVKACHLSGESGECGIDKPWCTKLVAAGMRQAHKLQKARDDERDQRRHRDAMASFGIRREALGSDRRGRLYWWLDDGKLPGHPKPQMPRLFVQEHNNDDTASSWRCVATRSEINKLRKALDDDHSAEHALKIKLADVFDFLAEDEEPPTHDAVNKSEWRHTGSHYLGRLVVRRIQGTTVEGLVAGWLSAEDNDGQALWHIEHSDGDEEDLEAFEIEDATVDFDRAFRRYVNISHKAAGAFDYHDPAPASYVHSIMHKLCEIGYAKAQILSIADIDGYAKDAYDN